MSFFSDQLDGGTTGPSAAVLKLPRVGTGFWGTIESITTGNKRKYNPGGPKEDAIGRDGQPIPELRVVVKGTPDGYATATAGSHPKDENTGQELPDDGHRLVFISKGTNLSFATARALKEAGAIDKDLEVGGMLSVQYTEDIPTPRGPARGHTVKYKAPEAGAAAPAAQPAPAPVAAPPASNEPPF